MRSLEERVVELARWLAMSKIMCEADPSLIFFLNDAEAEKVKVRDPRALSYPSPGSLEAEVKLGEEGIWVILRRRYLKREVVAEVLFESKVLKSAVEARRGGEVPGHNGDRRQSAAESR